MSRDADLAFAHALADAADAITLARFRAIDLVGRDEARPDAGHRGRPRRRGGDPRARRDAGPGESVLGEEFGDDGGDVALDRRPDRRDDELRARHPGLGNAARARARRRRRGRRSCRRRRSAAAGGRRAARAPSRADGERMPRVGRGADRGLRRLDDGAARDAAGLGRGRARAPGSVRGLSDFWQHCLVAEGVARRRGRSAARSCGTTPPSGSSSRRPAAAAPPSTGGELTPGGTVADARTARCTNRSPPCWRTSPAGR